MFQKIKQLFLTNQTTKQTLAKNTFWLTFGNIFSRLIRGIFLIFAARFLGVNEFGVFNYVLTFAGIFTIFSDIGLNTILTREIAKQKDEKVENQIFSTIFSLKIILLILTSLILIFIAPHFAKIEKAKAILPFMALLTLIDGIRDFSSSYFRGKEKMEYEALLISSSNLTIALIGFFILTLKPEAKTLALAYTFSSGTGMLLGLYLLRNKFKKFFYFINKELIPFILKSSLPIALVAVIGVLLTQIDIIMLGFFKTEKEVGIYSAAQKIIILLYVLPAILTNVFFPIFSKLVHNNENEKNKKILENALKINFILALPLILGGLILSNQIIKFLYTTTYLESVIPFQILILTILPVFLGNILTVFLMAHNQQKKIAQNTVIGSISNIFLNFFLIKLFSIFGAALATLISQSLYNYLNSKTVKNITSFKILNKINKIIIATLIMTISLIILKQFNLNLLINIFLGAIIYIATLYFLKEKIILEIKNMLTEIKN